LSSLLIIALIGLLLAPSFALTRKDWSKVKDADLDKGLLFLLLSSVQDLT
jgi:hypothetical protein